MTVRFSAYPAMPSSHPVLARCESLLEANELEAALRSAGIACIRLDREAASIQEGRNVPEAALLLVSREEYARAKQVLLEGGFRAGMSRSAEPA
jgi:hypothetical protein